jgi:hypothetical protein
MVDDSRAILTVRVARYRPTHVHEAAHTALHSPSGRRRWDGSHFAVPKSPLCPSAPGLLRERGV